LKWSLVYRLIHTTALRTSKTSIPGWAIRAATGGRHAGCGRPQQQRQNMVRHGGDFHSDALRVVERYRMTGRTPSSTKRPSRIRKFHEAVDPPARFASADRSGQAFRIRLSSGSRGGEGFVTREERTWYPGSGIQPPTASPRLRPRLPHDHACRHDHDRRSPAANFPANIRRTLTVSRT